jgi:AraC-like DNA-binding protein
VYAEFPAPGLAALWMRTVEEDGAARILPDACCDLVWRGGTTVLLAGPDTTAWMSEVKKGDTIVGARFLPGTAAFDLPLHEATNLRLPLIDLGDAPARPLAEIERLAASFLRPDPAVAEAARRLADPRQRVPALAADLGLSERQLRRRCRAAAGYGPKTLQRVLRFRRFLELEEPDLAARAFAAGYADQAHATNDCTELAGLSPAALLSSGAGAA